MSAPGGATFRPEGRWRQRRVGVVLGGLSSEREISERSGQAVAAALRRRGYAVVEIPSDRDLPTRLVAAGAEVIFNALHGRYGEDGCVQGVFEMIGLPYTGAGVLSSALCMDKWRARQIMAAAGVPVAIGALLRGDEVRLPADMPLPCVVKPRGEGSSNGVVIVREPEAFAAACTAARGFDGDVLVEEYVAGTEVTVALLDGRALAAMEVEALGDDFHTWDVKYTPGRERFVLPAPLGENYAAVLAIAERAHAALDAGAYSRVDLRVWPDGRPVVLECNTLPGLHELGWYPAMARHAGLEFDDLIELLLDRAELTVRETRR